jgi:hypothetical protein
MCPRTTNLMRAITHSLHSTFIMMAVFLWANTVIIHHLHLNPIWKAQQYPAQPVSIHLPLLLLLCEESFFSSPKSSTQHGLPLSDRDASPYVIKLVDGSIHQVSPDTMDNFVTPTLPSTKKKQISILVRESPKGDVSPQWHIYQRRHGVLFR